MPATDKGKTYQMCITALMVAATCVIAPISIPIGPVPISLGTLAIYLSLYLLGWRQGVKCVIAYIILGMVGFPVFSGFIGGLGKIVGPTGGYIIGYLPLALIAGYAIERSTSRIVQFGGMALGTLAAYAIGTAWFCFVTSTTPAAAIATCVIPFLIGDVLKIALSMKLGSTLKTMAMRY